MLFLAVDETRGLGFTQLYPSFSSVSMRRLWILNDLFVASGERGRGVGFAPLEQAARLAVESQAKRLVLATATDNVPAQRLYEKMGWEKDTAFYHYSLSV